MKKPLLVILIIGLVPIVLLIIGLIISHNNSQNQITTDNYTYPYTDNALLYEKDSRNLIETFFTEAGKGQNTLNLFEEQTLDQLKYSNIYDTKLSQLLSNIQSTMLLEIAPFEVNSWTENDHLYFVTYEMKITDNSLTILGSNGINNKLFLVSKVDANWLITDITEAP